MKRGFGPNVYSERDGDVVRITLDRPDRLNALVGSMRTDLLNALTDASSPPTRVILLTGAGRAFCAGADIHALDSLLRSDDEAGFAELVKVGIRVVHAIRTAPQLVIAAVNGVAAGAGASLAAACDLRIAADSASIGFTFNRIGLHPDWGATYTLPRIVGQARAAELIYTGRMLVSAEALSYGLFDRVVAAPSLMTSAMSWARDLGDRAFVANAAAKATLDLNAGTKLREHCEAELAAQLDRFRTAEVRNRVAGFVARKAPADPDGPSDSA